jgi:hypothetical protein
MGAVKRIIKLLLVLKYVLLKNQCNLKRRALLLMTGFKI